MATRRRGRPARDAEETPRRKNSIFVKVGQTGGRVVEVCLNGGRTVEDALDASDVSYSDSNRIRVNGSPADLEDELQDGDIVTISGRVKGGVN